MKKTALLLLFVSGWVQATITPSTCSSHPCTMVLDCASTICNGTEDTELQTALDDTSVQCGDTIALTAGKIWTGNFTFSHIPSGSCGYVNIQSTLASTLCPADGVRVTPSHAANMPKITNGGLNATATLSFPDSATAGTHVLMNCIELEQYQNSGSSSGGDVLRVSDITSNEITTIPSDIIFKHMLVHGRIGSDSDYTKNGITTSGSSVTVQDSFIYEIKSDAECHAIIAANPINRQLTKNNFMEASTIPLFYGGLDGGYLTTDPNANIYSYYNYIHKPLKWRTSSVLNVKNMIEFKMAKSGDMQWNTIDNNYRATTDDQSGHALAINARFNSPGFYGPSINTGTDVITTAYTHHISSGNLVFFTDNLGHGTIPAGLEVCLKTALCYAEVLTPTTLQVSTTLNGTPINITSSGSGSFMMGVLESWTGTKNVNFQNNVVRDGYGTWSTLMVDNDYDQVLGPKVSSFTITNNLFYNIGTIWDITPPSSYSVNYGSTQGTGGGYDSYTHNTTVPSDTQASPPSNTRIMSIDGSTQTVNFSYLNNLEPSGSLPWKGSGTLTAGSPEILGILNTINQYFGGASLFENSVSVDLGDTQWSACTSPRVCSGMFYPTGAEWDANIMQWSDPTHNKYDLLATSPYYQRGTDGKDLGADMSKLARIQDLSVSPTNTTATLTFFLTTQISTQPCVLEVSLSSNVINEVSTYTVINILRPDYFTRRDSSPGATSEFSISGSSATWVIGKNANENDVNMVSRDLRLSPNTTYYGRLMAYGDTQTFQFTTTSGGVSSTPKSFSGNGRFSGGGTFQ